jgi:hypothetical protein
LIYEKCKPVRVVEDNRVVNVDTAFHWGQKYEPLSVALYERMYNTKVEDFGCIQHDVHKFLGASPDGINVNMQSGRYGRMLEIKNVVSRDITGIPKKEYWVQMQLQMEVCDLDECDFLETKFVEYENYQAFLDDTETTNKGMFMHFSTFEGKPVYVHKPLDLVDFDEWEQQRMELQTNCGNFWTKNCYWKLHTFSCVLVLRNKQWFQDSVGQLATVWSIIEQERISGYEHRAPKKRIKKTETGTGCLLPFTKTL